MIGWVREPERILEVQEALVVEGFLSIRVHYMGDDMVLLLEGKVSKFIEENKE